MYIPFAHTHTHFQVNENAMNACTEMRKITNCYYLLIKR